MRMRQLVGVLVGVLASLPLFASTLEEAFDAPPQSAGAYAWWHWWGGNVSKAGITRDLEAMKRAGLAGATVFHVDSFSTFPLATNAVTAGMTYRSPTWWRMMRFAADEARRLGLELGYCNSAGYSCSGGPWVTPELSMKKLVWTKAPKGERPAHPEIVRGFYREIGEVAVGDTVYRIGYTSTGKCVHPAPVEIAESGLEADKMSSKAMNIHWDHAIDEVVRNLGGASRPGLTHVLMDSYEAGDHDWTDDFADQFAKRRGYDPVPLLPYLLDKSLPPKPDFAEDFRLTKEELLTENHFELFKRRANAAGLEMHLEPYTGPFDSIVASTIPDVPMTEFWSFPVFWAPEESRFGGDVWFCGPAARAVGHTIIGAESFTAMPQDDMWSVSPRHLKRALDATYARGVNRISLHHWVHQPLDPKWAPGFTMGFWGTHFGECQTWFEPAIGFYRYMQRCQALCQRGEEVVDTLSVNEGFPAGQRGDTVPTKVFLSDAVEVLPDGSIRLPSGRRYRYLREPWSYAPSAAITNRIAELVRLGAKLWTPDCEKQGPVSILSGDPSCAVLALARVEKGRSFFFLCNSSTNALDLVCRFRSEGRFQLWWPYTGRKTGFDGSHLHLEPLESVFVVSGCAAPLPVETPRAFVSARSLKPVRLTIDGKTFANPELVSWTESKDPDVRFFSGTAEYEFRLENVPARTRLDLGDVRDVAEVFLDGRRLASLWYPPYRLELPAVRSGVMTVRVTNGWRNRLVGDERLPPDCEWSPVEKMRNLENEMQEIGRGVVGLPDWVKGVGARPTARKAFSTWNYFTKDSPLQPSGLLGPVSLDGGGSSGYDIAAYVWPAYQPEPRWAELGIFSKGVGEWQNVQEAVPKWEGHRQPLVPLWGYENEAEAKVVEKKIDAALAHGVNVFIYDWYWYGGRPFLEDALNDGFLNASNNEKMGFFIMWANHHVNRLWDNRVADKQWNDPIWRGWVKEDEFKVIGKRWIVRYFTRPNYYRIDGKPVLMIYDIDTFVEGLGGLEPAARAIAWLREACEAHGLGGLHLMACDCRLASEQVKALGVDSATIYNFVHWSTPNGNPDYADWAAKGAERFDAAARELGVKDYFAHASVGWDTNPRYPQKSIQATVLGSTPDKFEVALRRAKDWCDAHTRAGGPRLITVNSWNEWTEGSYLEPDVGRRYGYLNAIRRVFCPMGRQQ